MKRLEITKSIQFIILLTIAGICFYLIVLKSNIYHLIAESAELRLLCTLLWIVLLVSFFFVFLDFTMYSKQKSTMNALDYAAHTDNLAKIANRQGCDEIIDKYIDQDLPENMACIMFLLSSLNDVNKKYTRMDGNKQIRNFSIILKLASIDRCFVGRNGGNVFMAIFEDTSKESIDEFLDRILKKVIDHNYDKKNLPMYYKYGLAYHEEDLKNITELVSLSSRRAQTADITPEDLSELILGSATTTDAADSEHYTPVVSVDSNPVDSTLEKSEEEKINEIEQSEEKILSELNENLKKNNDISEEKAEEKINNVVSIDSATTTVSQSNIYKYSEDELEDVVLYDDDEVDNAAVLVDKIA